MDLKQIALRGLKWTTLTQILLIFLGLTERFLLATWIAPAEFGVLATCLIVIDLVSLFIGGSTSQLLILRRSFTSLQVTTLFWTHLFSGIILMGIVILIAPLCGDFFHAPLVSTYLPILSLTILLSSIGQMPVQINQRELKLKEQSLIELISLVLGITASITFVWLKFEGKGLIYGVLVRSISYNLLSFILARKYLKISFAFQLSSIKEFYHFGGFNLSALIVGQVNSKIDTVLVSRYLGQEATGIYDLAKNVSLKVLGQISPIISRVGLPVLVNSENQEDMKKIYLKIIRLSTLVAAPALLVIIGMADEMIHFIWSAEWVESIPVLKIMCAYGIVRILATPISILIYSNGRSDLNLYWNIFQFFVISFSVYVGLHFGVLGVAYGMLFSMIFSRLPSWYFLVRPMSGLGAKEYFLSFLKPLFLVSVVFSAIFIFISYFKP